METKEVITSFGKVKVKQLSVLDKLNVKYSSEKTFIDACIADEESRKLMNENSGKKEDMELIVDAISEVNGFKAKANDPNLKQ